MDFGTSARAIIERDGYLLVESWKNGARTFLPGGRVEPGEDLATALLRELREEIGASDFHIKQYVGTIESRWRENQEVNRSLGHFFLVSWDSGSYEKEICSPEQGRHFCWIPLTELEARNLVPPKLRTLIPNLVRYGLTTPWIELDEDE